MFVDTPYHWSQVTEVARKEGRRTVVIGILGPRGELELAPPAQSTIHLPAGAMLVTIEKGDSRD